MPAHVASRPGTLARPHADSRYDRPTRDFEAILGRLATIARDSVASHPELFGPRGPDRGRA